MFHLGLVEVVVAEREREIETNIRRRRLLQPEDGATEIPAPVRRNSTRAVAIRVRPTEG